MIGNTIEQRAHPRQPLYLDMEVSRSGVGSEIYGARNFCRGGLLLLAKASRTNSLLGSLKRGDKISISFVSQDLGAATEFQFDACVARVFDAGIGVAFSYIEPSVMGALQRLAELTLPPSEKSSQTSMEIRDRDEVLVQCKRVVSHHLSAIIQDFLKQADDKLIDHARNSKTNSEQGDYFEALAEIMRFRSSISGVFLDTVLARFEELLNPSRRLENPMQDALHSFELSIVDPDEFEHWVAISAMSSKVESLFTTELFDIRQRLSALFKRRSFDEKMNPVGPTAICHAFREAIKVLHIRPPVSDAVYHIFEAVVAPHLSRLYIGLNELFTDHDILPVVPRKPVVIEQSVAPPKKHPVVEDKAEPKGERTAAGRSGEVHAETGSSGGNAYNTAIELLSLRRLGEAGVARPQSKAAGLGESGVGLVADEVEALGRVLRALPRIEELDIKSELLAAVQCVEAIRDMDGVSPQLADSIEIGVSLIDSILDDEILADSIKPYINKLKVTLLKVALLDQQLFSIPTHPARQFLDLLARLRSGIGLGGLDIESDPELQHTIETVVDRIDRHYDDDPGVFLEAVEDLTPIFKRQEESFTRNVFRVIKTCQGAQKVSLARRQIRDEMTRRLVGKQVPTIVLELLRLGWPKLLFVSLLRHGEASREWQDNLNVIDHLLFYLKGDGHAQIPEVREVQVLIAEIEQGLDYICSYSFRLKELLAELEALLSEQRLEHGTSRVAMELVNQEMVDSLLGYTLDADVAAQSAVSYQGLWDEKIGGQQEYLQKAKTLKTGDWVQYQHPTLGGRLLKLVWIDEEALYHVFVDRRGIKALELGLYELASQLQSGTLTMMEEDEPSLFDRGLHRMLQQMHEKLAFQASHDPETGLLNRKEFHKQLEFALANAKPRSERQMLCHIDFGNFNLIKSVCGYDAVEELLKQIVLILQERIGEETVLARLGDTRFGLLMDNCPENEAYSRVEGVRDAFSEFRFEWHSENHNITISSGLAALSEDCESVEELVRMADAACYAARDSGLNRIQLYEADDAELARRQGVMSWLTRINTVLEKNGLELYCHRISPLVDDPDRQAHYEILTRVVADDGAHISPVTFIKAAELSGRMVDVDKWIIRNVFDWMIDHYRYMHDFGGFAINLSGCSLNDQDFPDFLLEELKKTNVPTDKICFEVTETAAIYNLSNAADFISRIKEVGCKFALDDFGSGMSSYSYLKHLPVDYVKIDGVFVKDIASNESDYAMVKSINEICHFLGKQTIAEYIEDEQIRDRLLEIGVDFAQGYFIEMPRPLKGITASDMER